MHIDLEEVPNRATFRSTVCVIGAGVAGLLLADRLANSGIDVNLLEAGGRTAESRSQTLYDVERQGRYHHGATEGRFRVFGGSSTRWGAQLLPYSDDIFKPPAETSSAGWPISGANVEPYFADLYKIMHVPEASPENEWILSSDINVRFSKWAPFSKRNLANTVGKKCLASKRVKVFYHANATSVEIDEQSGSVDRIEAKNYSGKAYEFQARYFVLCTGTIEASRLLLSSTSKFREGVGNASGQVGRFFHDHVSVAAATMTGQARSIFVKSFSPVLLDGVLHSPKLEASAALRQGNHLLAVMAHFAIEEPDDNGIAAVRSFLQCVQRGQSLRKLPQLAAAVVRNSAEIANFVWSARVQKRRAISDRARITLRIDCEQTPSAERRITLSTSRDTLGMPKAIVHWCISEKERRTVRVYARCVDRLLKRLGAGSLAWNPQLWDRADPWTELAQDTYHPMGGTRMGLCPETSVVDPDLKVHGIPNLFVASCSTFPGGGSSNPTFTLMALALRLASHVSSLVSAPLVSYRSNDEHRVDLDRRVPAHK